MSTTIWVSLIWLVRTQCLASKHVYKVKTKLCLLAKQFLQRSFIIVGEWEGRSICWNIKNFWKSVFHYCNRPFQKCAWSCVTSYYSPLRGSNCHTIHTVNPAMGMMSCSSMLAFEKVYSGGWGMDELRRNLNSYIMKTARGCHSYVKIGYQARPWTYKKYPKLVFPGLKFPSLNKYSSGIWHPKQMFLLFLTLNK